MLFWASFGACGAVVKNLPANTGHTRDRGSILGREDPQEQEMETTSSVLAWKISWTDDPSGLLSMGHKELDMTEPTGHRKK